MSALSQWLSSLAAIAARTVSQAVETLYAWSQSRSLRGIERLTASA